MGIAIAALAGTITRRVVSAQPRAFVPTTVTLQEVTTPAKGQPHYANTYIFAQRSDGSSVFVGGGLPQYPQYVTRTIRSASGQRITVQDHRGLKSTLPVKWNSSSIRVPGNNCVLPGIRESATKGERISGHLTAKIEQKPRTSWYALDAGCALVHERVAFSNGAVSEKTLFALELGEPSASLFDVPRGYTESRPSALGMLPGEAVVPGTPWAGQDREYDAAHRR